MSDRFVCRDYLQFCKEFLINESIKTFDEKFRIAEQYKFLNINVTLTFFLLIKAKK